MRVVPCSVWGTAMGRGQCKHDRAAAGASLLPLACSSLQSSSPKAVVVIQPSTQHTHHRPRIVIPRLDALHSRQAAGGGWVAGACGPQRAALRRASGGAARRGGATSAEPALQRQCPSSPTGASAAPTWLHSSATSDRLNPQAPSSMLLSLPYLRGARRSGSTKGQLRQAAQRAGQGGTGGAAPRHSCVRCPTAAHSAPADGGRHEACQHGIQRGVVPALLRGRRRVHSTDVTVEAGEGAERAAARALPAATGWACAWGERVGPGAGPGACPLHARLKPQHPCCCTHRAAASCAMRASCDPACWDVRWDSKALGWLNPR